MSFNNPFESDDLERQQTNTSLKYKDYPEFDSISTSIENQLAFINKTQLSSIKRDLSKFDKESTLDLSESLSGNFKKTTEYFKKVNEYIKKLDHIINELTFQHEDVEIINYFKQKEQIQVKLIKDSLLNFKNLQKRFESIQSKSLPSSSTLIQDDSSPQQQQQQVRIEYEPVNAEELEQQALMVEEREREIHQIQQDTQEINDIFANLSNIINEQQFQIDSIENNIFSYSSNAKQAVSELRSAERWQKRSNGRMFCCFMILLGVAAFFVLLGVIF